MHRYLILAASFAVLAAGGVVRAGQLECGGESGGYSDDLGRADAEFAALVWDLGPAWSLRADLGREARFADRGLGGGLAATYRFTENGATLGAGISTGTGEVIHPEYRCDLGGLIPLPGGAVQATWGYTRLQSKGDNSSDGVSLGLTAWLAGHWIAGVSGRHEIGHPGDTTSDSGDVSLTWFRWQKVYLGAGYRFGTISYQLIGTGPALVDYAESAVYGMLTVHLAADRGLNARVDRVENDLYRLTAVRVGLFRTW
jgi:YaiO family outer membrane protein